MSISYQPIADKASHLLSQMATEPRRLFHGRGHLFEGLEHINIDWYPPVLLITGYADINDIEKLLEHLLTADKQDQVKSVVYQQRSSRGANSDCIWGEEIDRFVVEEASVKYEVQPGVRQNAGFFLDMRPLRRWLLDYSKGKNLLNLFSYTCSLSVAALEGGARQVVNVDMSKPSINWGIRNHELNGHDPRSIKSIPHNLFKSWGRIQKSGPYETIIIDPPTRQVGSFDAEKDYPTILKKLNRLYQPGADIIATVNSPYLGLDYLPNLMQRYQSNVKLIGEFPASEEFEDRYPERALKIYHFRAK